MVKNTPSSKGQWFDCWSRKIPHATEQQSSCATASEPAHLEPLLYSKRSHCSEKSTHHNKEQPLLAITRESPSAVRKTNHSQKLNK